MTSLPADKQMAGLMAEASPNTSLIPGWPHGPLKEEAPMQPLNGYQTLRLCSPTPEPGLEIAAPSQTWDSGNFRVSLLLYRHLDSPVGLQNVFPFLIPLYPCNYPDKQAEQ